MSVTVSCKGTVRLVAFGAAPHGILTSRDVRELAATMSDVLGDEAARAVVIAGSDTGLFIRHYDLASIRKAADALRSGGIEPDSFLEADFARLTDAIAASPIPVIAAINGICMGGGFELALACDIRVAQHDVAHIGLPEIRIDIFPGGGGTIRLARLIGEGPALDIALRGRTLDARRALELGIVSEVSDDAVGSALEIAESLASREPLALAAIKRLVRSASDGPLAERLAAERLEFAELLARSDTALASMDALLASGVMLEDAPSR